MSLSTRAIATHGLGFGAGLTAVQGIGQWGAVAVSGPDDDGDNDPYEQALKKINRQAATAKRNRTIMQLTVALIMSGVIQ